MIQNKGPKLNGKLISWWPIANHKSFVVRKQKGMSLITNSIEIILFLYENHQKWSHG